MFLQLKEYCLTIENNSEIVELEVMNGGEDKKKSQNNAPSLD